MDLPTRSEWLADLLVGQRDLVTQCWIEEIRAENIPGYEIITDEQLREELPPTVDSMIYAFRTGDTEGPRRHSLGVIQRRLAAGFKLPDLQMSLHALQTAVMRVVKRSNLGPVKEFEALLAASNLYYLVALIAAAVYEQLRTEQQKRFTSTYEFGTTLSKTLDLNAVLDIAVEKVAAFFEGKSVAILLAESNGGQSELQAHYNLNERLAREVPGIHEALGCGLLDAKELEVREIACSVPDVRAYGRLDRWSELLTSFGILSMVCVPLVAKQKRLGSLMIFWPDVHTLTNSQNDFLYAVAGHIANALHNAILFEEAKGKRELGVLLDSSRLFVSSLDTHDVLRKVARMASEAVRADLAIVSTRDSMREHANNNAYYVRSHATSAVRRIIEAVVAEAEATGFDGLGEDFASGKAILYDDFAEFSERIQRTGAADASGIAVPLRQKDALLGALILVSLAPDAFKEEDLVLATGLADLAAVAIENARLYEYEKNIARTLQKSFLPSSLPEVEGYQTAAYYRPAMAEAEIGGDFYDVFASGEGNVSVVIGDVSGKGLKAAIPTAMSRYIIRAFAAENPMPSDIISRFSRAFYENATEGLFMTLLYGSLNPEDNLFTYISAGHDPPLLYRAESAEVSEIITDGLCLGVTADSSCSDKTLRLQPGDVLLMYTDGATDVRGDRDRLGIAGLKQLFLSNVGKSAEEIIQNLSSGICDYSRGNLSDDVALVVLKRVDRSS